jgi:glycosyltransferase involved in cell wall biosynthesis
MARIAELKPDLVVANETLLAPMAAFAPARWRVVHTHNHESHLDIAHDPRDPEAAHRARAARRLEHIERTLFPRVDQVWGVRQEDLAAYHAMGTGWDHLRLAPNVVPDACFVPAPVPGQPGHAVFFGSLWYQPNRTALLRILDLWPALRERVPGARLTVAGRGATPDLEARAQATGGVDLLGFVPDLQALLREAAVVVIPLEDGGGTKIKTIEAMAAGKPILASPVAAEGLLLEDGDQVVIRPVGPEFLEALVDLIQAPDRWQDLGLRALEHARRHYSMANLRTSLGLALDELMGA